MKEKTFQIVVLSVLGLVLIIGVITLFAKKQGSDGKSEIAMFGKTLWKEKDKTASTKTEDKKTEDKKAA